MKRLMLCLLLLLGVSSTFAQTIYYNHPVGVQIGPFYKGEMAVVAQVTLPAGTYHAIFKSQFASITNPSNPYVCPTCGGPVFCYMYGTGIANVSNPYLLDMAKIRVQPDTVYVPAADNMTLQTAFSTTGGKLYVACTTKDQSGGITSARTSLSALKLGTLNKQSYSQYDVSCFDAATGKTICQAPSE
jgi:hypothetical protein